jgi:DNA (cytosine-5)-methyltransferase 1
MKSLELFSGCGGLAKGLANAGFEHLAFIEFNHWACESLRRNFSKDIVYEKDVRNVDFSSFQGVDLIAGGPPCQPFSLGGLAKAYDDHRDMFPQAIRAIQELKPKGFIFENVKGLTRKSFSEYFDYIILRLTFPDYLAAGNVSWRKHLAELRSLEYQNIQSLKYRVQFRLLNAVDFGVPQNRERVFIVGIRSDIHSEWEWPDPSVKPSERLTVGDVIKKLPDPQDNHRMPDHVFVDGARIYAGHTGSELNKPSKTIKAGAHGVPGGENMIRFPDGSVRYMTIREAKLIQTFPATYQICGPWGEALRQIGNAVPVKLAELIGRNMYKALRFSQQTLPEEIIYRTGTDGAYLLFEKQKCYTTRRRASKG